MLFRRCLGGPSDCRVSGMLHVDHFRATQVGGTKDVPVRKVIRNASGTKPSLVRNLQQVQHNVAVRFLDFVEQEDSALGSPEPSSSEPYKYNAVCFALSVFPTPVGPSNKNDAFGRPGIDSPDSPRAIAFEICLRA